MNVRGDWAAYREIIEAFELGGLHDCVEHSLDDEARVRSKIVGHVHTDKSLEKADHDHEEQQKKDERLAHHDLEHYQHGAEESEGVDIQQQSHPEHGRREGQKVV
jgi:hypothetical protein